MPKYTAFCQEAGGGGTIWISPVEAPTADEAIDLAQKTCAEDWEFDDIDDVHVLGLAADEVKILFWEDIAE